MSKPNGTGYYWFSYNKGCKPEMSEVKSSIDGQLYARTLERDEIITQVHFDEHGWKKVEEPEPEWFEGDGNE